MYLNKFGMQKRKKEWLENYKKVLPKKLCSPQVYKILHTIMCSQIRKSCHHGYSEFFSYSNYFNVALNARPCACHLTKAPCGFCFCLWYHKANFMLSSQIGYHTYLITYIHELVCGLRNTNMRRHKLKVKELVLNMHG
jgi:hypothetical protein